MRFIIDFNPVWIIKYATGDTKADPMLLDILRSFSASHSNRNWFISSASRRHLHSVFDYTRPALPWQVGRFFLLFTLSPDVPNR